MPLRYVSFPLLLLVLGLPRASAQEATRPRVLGDTATQQLVRRYAQQQRDAAQGVQSAVMAEHLVMTWDAPFGQRKVLIEAVLVGGADQRAWQREVVRVIGEPKPGAPRRGGDARRPRRAPPGRGRSPGRGAPPPRGDHRAGPPPPEAAPSDPTRDDKLRPMLRRLLQPERIGQVHFGALRPVRGATSERVDGIPAWRIGLLPEREGLLQQATVWISQDGTRLLRSRYTLRPKDDSAPIEVVTTYARQDGLDVSRTRSVTSTEQVRRRLRTFTVRFRAEAAYDEAVLERE